MLCAVDWLGIANESQREFRQRLAQAAGTSAERVVVHTLHQHDAPRCDFSSREILAQVGLADRTYDVGFCRDVMLRASNALAKSLPNARRVTHLGLGQALVDKVASNRRILGPDGRVQYTRYTACRDPMIRAMPVGTIDPRLRLISLWDGEDPVLALTYYATHPQSYYRTGKPSPDFPGIARNEREQETGVPHIHFDGAGGNIGAGKWNDGSPENRRVLADRIKDAMQAAWKTTERQPLAATDVQWTFTNVLLPPGKHLVEEPLLAVLKDETRSQPERLTAAKHLAWLHRSLAGEPVQISCLKLGPARVLHLPGEPFVEYQLAAQSMAPDLFVAVAGYGEYGPGYIGTRIAYSQGGYETSTRASRVAPEVESVLHDAMRKLLAP